MFNNIILNAKISLFMKKLFLILIINFIFDMINIFLIIIFKFKEINVCFIKKLVA